MKETKINTYECITSPYVQSSIGIDAVIEEIRTGNQFGRLVEHARRYGKGSPEFEQIKVNQIGTYTLNATFNGYRKETNLNAPTGLLYVDIDGCTEVDLTNPLIFAAYKSVSATGMTVIVKVANLTSDNIKPVYTYVGQELGVKLDSSCAEMSRQTVFSYDPDVTINYESDKLDAAKLQLDKERGNSPLLNFGRERSSSDLPLTESDELVYNEYHLFDFNEKDFILFEHKRWCVEVYIPRVIKCGKRYVTISTIILNMCYLNPQLRGRRLYGFIQTLNSRCEKRLGTVELKKIFREITRKLETAPLVPIPTRLRKIVFSPTCPAHIKRKMTAVAAGLVRSKKTYLKINEALENWDLLNGIITNVKLALNAGVSLKTLKKYLKNHPELKTKKEEINNAIKDMANDK